MGPTGGCEGGIRGPIEECVRVLVQGSCISVIGLTKFLPTFDVLWGSLDWIIVISISRL